MTVSRRVARWAAVPAMAAGALAITLASAGPASATEPGPSPVITEPVFAAPAVCKYGGQEFSEGAVIFVGPPDTGFYQQCQADGTWKKYTPKDAEESPV